MQNMYTVQTPIGYYMPDGDFSPCRKLAASLTRGEAEQVAAQIRSEAKCRATLRLITQPDCDYVYETGS